MKPLATIVIPHAFSTRWTQVAVSSILEHKNEATSDIMVVDNSLGHPSIKGITETRLGESVRIVSPEDPLFTGHQQALDRAIDLVETPWLIAWEPDVRVMRDGWADWMLSHIKDDFTVMAGWYWDAGFEDGRHYISPAGALYRTSILKMLKEECLRNKDMAVCWGRDMSKRINLSVEYEHTAGMLIPKGKWGPFSECRGFGNVYPFPVDKWVPEPGNWIYNRCSMQWECIKLPGGMVFNDQIGDTGIPHKHTFVGPSEAEAYFIHYWAGSVSHNFDKHNIYDFDVPKLAFWLKRERRIWDEQVPEDIKKISIESGLVKGFDEELAYAMTKVIPWK